MFEHSPHSLAGFRSRFMFPGLDVWGELVMHPPFHNCGALMLQQLYVHLGRRPNSS